MSSSVSLYNPRDTDPEQLEKMLTGRSALLEEILEDLRGQAGGSTRQHWLLRGQRGMGKTHLTGVIHYRVRTDSMLQKVYLPLWLGEADVYEVYSAATLLVKVAERLAEETCDESVLQRMRALEGLGDEEAFFEAMLELLSGEAERREQVLLVLMENLDALLESFAPKERATQTRQLRSVLLHNPRFLFISTTPTRYLRSLSNPKEPLYGHLKERDLSPLTEQEMGDLFQKLVELTGRKELEAVLLGEEGPLRVRVIHQLTGGLPRSVIMAFTVMQGGAGLGALIEGLRKFLDAQTAYFEARLARLAPRERAIVTTMALARENLTLKEIAQRSRLPERTLSTHIQRLEADGHVRPVSGSVGKGSLYELSEGLFRLWYQFRRGQMVLEPLVAFIATWFRAEEIETLVHEHRRRRDESTPMQRRAAELALLQVEAALQRATSDEGKRQRDLLWENARKALCSAVPTTDELLSLFKSQALLVLEKGQPEQCVRRFLEIWESQAGDRKRLLLSVLDSVSSAAVKRMEAGGSVQRELRIHQLLIEKFGLDPDVELQLVLDVMRWVQVELLGALDRYEEGVVNADDLLERARRSGRVDASLFEHALASKSWFLSELGRYDESLDALLVVLRSPPIKPRVAEYGLASFVWQKFISGKAAGVLGGEKYWDLYFEVLKIYVERFSVFDEPDVRFWVSHSALGMLKGQIERTQDPQEALVRVDDWLRRHGPGLGGQMQHVLAMVYCGRASLGLGSRDFGVVGDSVESVVGCFPGMVPAERQEVMRILLEGFPRFTAAMGPVRMFKLIADLEQPWLDESSRQQLSTYKRLTELLMEELGAPKRSKQSRQEQMHLLRVPPELRKTLESTVRQVHKLKKTLGAEW